MKKFLFKLGLPAALMLMPLCCCGSMFDWTPKITFLWSCVGFAILLFISGRMSKRCIRGLGGNGISNLRNYCVVDIETTGLDPAVDEITEIAALKIRKGRVVDSFQSLCAIKGFVPFEIEQKTHITNEMLSGAMPIKTVLSSFLDFIGGDILVGYNIEQFDIKFLRSQSRRKLRRSIGNNVLDVWQMVKNCYPNLACYKLDYLRELFGINGEGAHRALKDCYDTNILYREILSGKTSIKAITAREMAIADKTRTKPLFALTDADLKEKFGENWEVARKIIEDRSAAIARGEMTDWYSYIKGQGYCRATDAQIGRLRRESAPRS